MEHGTSIKNELTMESNNTQPQHWIFGFLKSFCPPSLLEEIEGDLIEKYEHDVKTFGEKKAKRKFLWNTIRFFRLGIILRNKFYIHLNKSAMIKSYVLVMLRSLMKRKFYAAINVLGLTLAIAFALVIGAFIQGELQVNQHIKDVDRVYMGEIVQPYYGIMLPRRLSELAMERYPTLFENYYRFWDRSITLSKDDKHFRIDSMLGDSTFFQLFGFRLLYGDSKTALTKINSVAITETVAMQFFNRTDVVGETLTIATEQNGMKEFVITAVVATPQRNTITNIVNMRARVFLPLENATDFFPIDSTSWDVIISYLKLKPNVSSEDATHALNSILKKDAPKSMAEKTVVSLSPLKSYYIKGSVGQQLITLAIIAFFILLLAVSNFVNISIASSFSRLKEVGVRKVIGGLKKQVITQFLLESTLMAFVAGIFALAIYQLIYPTTSTLFNNTLPSLIDCNLSFWSTFFSSIFIIGILAGVYPSFYLSLTKPVESLKGKLKSMRGTLQFSRSLIVLQFLVTVFIFCIAIILSQQISFFLEKDLGYNQSHVLIVNSVPRNFSKEGLQKVEAAKHEFLKSSKVMSATFSWGVPSWNYMFGGDQRMYLLGKSVEQGVPMLLNSADENYSKVYDIKLLDGKFLSDESSQTNILVLNQTAQKALGAQVGDKVKIESFGDTVYTIAGVVNDFHFESLQENLKPLAFIHCRDLTMFRYFSFKLSPGNLTESVGEVEKIWKQVFPNDPFTYDFADQRVKATYATELRLKKASSVATILMFAIVLMGVLGLVALSVSKRTKEIGIRKVLGASVSQVLILVSREYVMLMCVAFPLAIMSAYFLAMWWLQNFAYHIQLSWWMFAVPAVVLFVFILIAVSMQSLKTALSNPVDSLRYE